MRTNIEIDDDLLNEAFKYADVKTKRELVALGLKEFIENHRRKDLRELKGKVKISPDYNYKSMREGR
jgi:Arc/MetJ family transcription regulator